MKPNIKSELCQYLCILSGIIGVITAVRGEPLYCTLALVSCFIFAELFKKLEKNK